VAAVVKLCLGTAQLGLAYGVNNQKGILTDREATHLLMAAASYGFSSLDTSSEYGMADRRIDEFLKKYPGAFEVYKRGTNGYVSAYTPDEAEAADCKMIQVPANILDGRMDMAILRMRGQGKIVCIRSLLLQGLLAIDLVRGPGGNKGDGSYLPDACIYISMLENLAREFDMGLVEMCIRWAWEIVPNIAIIGCETADQAWQVTKYWKRGALPGGLVKRAKVLRVGVPEHVISPRSWKQVYAFT
jgi:aryl-alcohol dehydrogenase-like predicted oxidoreductase